MRFRARLDEWVADRERRGRAVPDIDLRPETVLERAHARWPQDETLSGHLRRLYLARLDYSFHEWPSGVLLAPGRSLADGVREVRSWIGRAEALEPSDAQARRLRRWRGILA
jgi:hypothetical protein